jgi:hypothetical protein
MPDHSLHRERARTPSPQAVQMLAGGRKTPPESSATRLRRLQVQLDCIELAPAVGRFIMVVWPKVAHAAVARRDSSIMCACACVQACMHEFLQSIFPGNHAKPTKWRTLKWPEALVQSSHVPTKLCTCIEVVCAGMQVSGGSQQRASAQKYSPGCMTTVARLGVVPEVTAYP